MNENKTTDDLIVLLAEHDERIKFVEVRFDRGVKLLVSNDDEIASSKEAA